MKNWQKIRSDQTLKNPFIVRSKILDLIRTWFKSQEFLEVETPLLAPQAGMEPYLEVFETKLIDDQNHKQRAFLLTSPEYAMKKILVAGFPKIFTICKSFRNGEGLSRKHNSEFTIMEWYRTEAGYEQIMQDCENLFLFIAQELLGSNTINWEYQGISYDLSVPWERISVADAFARYCSLDVETLLNEEKIIAAGEKRGFTVNEETTWEQMYNQFFLNDIEPHLGKTRPTIIYDFPVSQAALSKKKKSDPRFAERFEFYVAGIEMGNAFTELTNAQEQLERLTLEREERKKLGKVMYDIDMDFIEALKVGMPEAGGIAVGIDRIVMFFANVPSIQDVILFPTSQMWD